MNLLKFGNWTQLLYTKHIEQSQNFDKLYYYQKIYGAGLGKSLEWNKIYLCLLQEATQFHELFQLATQLQKRWVASR